MPVTCIGGHETRDWPCHKSTPSSCFRPCGQLLACTNHTCAKPCHIVDGTRVKRWILWSLIDFLIKISWCIGWKACQLCEDGCSKPRPEGCTHPCPRGLCHPGPCPPCMKFIKHSCHCGLYPQFLRCDQLANSSTSEQPDIKEQLLSCKDRCPKTVFHMLSYLFIVLFYIFHFYVFCFPVSFIKDSKKKKILSDR